MAVDVSKLKRRVAAMQADKDLHTSVWRDCFNVTLPERGSGLWSPITTASEAQQLKARIFDSTAPDAVTTGSATVMGAMVPANDLWFGLDVGYESDEERAWLDSAAQFMWENIHASNFDAEACDGMTDELIAGWFVLFIDGRDEGGYSFECWPLGQCSIASTRSGSMIDTVARTWMSTVGQVVAEYGLDKVSQATRDKYNDGQLLDKVEMQLLIEPRDGYVAGSKFARNMPFASCHWECKADHVVRESGFEEFPCSVPRWRRLPDSAYATGPMSSALPDTRTLNEVVRFTLMGAETAIAPPMIAEDDGVLNARNITLGPRKIIVANSVDSMKALVTGADVKAGFIVKESLQASIRKILLADQLPPQDGPTKTAYEWSVRVQALRAMLGPMFGRFQAEFLQPLIERCFGIMWRANIASGFRLVGRPPMSLLNRNFTIRYLSPLARAQKLSTVDAMDRYETTLLQEAQIDASVVDVYDFEEAARERGTLLGLPQKLVRDQRATDMVRRAKAQQAQQSQQQAMQQQNQVAMQDAMAQRMASSA